MSIKSSSPRRRLLAHLELMTMKMERMDSCIVIIYCELHDGILFDDEGVDVPVDYRVGVSGSRADSCEKRRNLL
jgi:hypothetical protein